MLGDLTLGARMSVDVPEGAAHMGTDAGGMLSSNSADAKGQ